MDGSCKRSDLHTQVGFGLAEANALLHLREFWAGPHLLIRPLEHLGPRAQVKNEAKKILLLSERNVTLVREFVGIPLTNRIAFLAGGVEVAFDLVNRFGRSFSGLTNELNLIPQELGLRGK